MRFCVLGSGSRGNCTYVEAGDTAILIDAGFSGREIERRLAVIGVDAASLTGLLLTHEHSDHLKGAGVLSRRYRLPVFANSATFQAAGRDLNKLFAWQEFETGTVFHFRDLAIHPFSISHDAADPVGFLVANQHFSLGYCTDTGTVSRLMAHRLAGCQALVLESNHDPEMLRTGPYPAALQQRVRSKTGHLANETAADFLHGLLHDRLEHVVLAHISETNNRPHLVRQSVEQVLSGVVGHRPRISLGLQEEAGELVMLGEEAQAEIRPEGELSRRVATLAVGGANS
jgi:phosphoribosyl 1,2-cyclic phosphodiesterase